MLLDVDLIVSEVRGAADRFLRPRFEALTSDEVREKSEGEVVTVADEECEAYLGPVLQAMVAGSALVGEEAVSQDPDLVRHLCSAGRVWLLDPLDGTAGFAEGSRDYAIMAALVEHGVTVLSVIHQPEYQRTFVAELGSGAYEFESGVKLSARPSDCTTQLRGAVMKRFMPPDVTEAMDRAEARFPTLRPRTGAAGIEYPAIAQGARDFMLYWRTHPWDHAPGALLLTEAGGMAASLNGAAYRPDEQREGLLVAHSPDLWERARVALEMSASSS